MNSLSTLWKQLLHENILVIALGHSRAFLSPSFIRVWHHPTSAHSNPRLSALQSSTEKRGKRGLACYGGADCQPACPPRGPAPRVTRDAS